METDYKRREDLSDVFSMMLFFIFILCALFTVLIGTKAYENIHARNQATFSKYVILDYVSNKVRQNEMSDSISVTKQEGIDILKMSEEDQGKTYVTMVYAYDGKLREILTVEGLEFNLADGLEVADCDGIEFSLDDGILTCKTTGEQSETLILDIRTDE